MKERAQEIMDQARASLARVADVRVEHRDVSVPEALENWRAGMPPRPSRPTMAEVEEKISATMANIDDRIDASFKARAWQRKASQEVIALALANYARLISRAARSSEG